MTDSSGPDAEVVARLFAPGQRLGWVFRDRHQFRQPFTEPAPQPQPIPEHLAHAHRDAYRRHDARIMTTWKSCAAILVVLVVLIVISVLLGDFSQTELPRSLLLAGGVTVAVGVAVTGLSKLILSRTLNTVNQTRQELDTTHEQDILGWQQRKTAFEQAEDTRIDQLPEWGAVRAPAGSRRLDIFGGNLWAWQAFLTVYGASTLAARPVIVVDLSREIVCRELVDIAEIAGVAVDFQVLSDHLAHTTLLSGLSARQIVDVVIESMYGDEQNATRHDRSVDDRILTTLCEALGNNVSLGRIAAGLRALLDQPDTTSYLTIDERNHITDELFSTQYRQDAKDQLHRLEAYIYPLEHLGTHCDADRHPAQFTCMALASEGHNVRADLLTDLIVQWLTHRITTCCASTPDVIIAGADALALRHLERLSDACERRNIHLTLLFRHLRGAAVNFLGGGVTGFMTMGNTSEATHAADFIGRHHTFVISQLTATLGGNETHTYTETHGESDTTGTSVSTSTGQAESSTHSTSSDNTTSSTSDSNNHSRTVSTNWSTTRNWSISRSWADGTNWSNAHTHQRVHEYTVEPTQLQHLPDHAMILITTQPGGTQPNLTLVEFDPAITTLSRVSTDPHPELPLPAPQPAALPAASIPALAYHHTTQHQFSQPATSR